MKAEIIFKSTRNAVLEITGFGKYKTISEYELYINDSFRMKSNKAVQTINGLTPDTEYTLIIKTNEGEQKCLDFRTEYEFVTLDVTKFGAKGDGISDDTIFIQTAINCCPKNGRVLVPAGTFRISSLFLKDNLHLEIAKDAVVLAFTEKEKFPVLPGNIESYDEIEDYNLGSWEGNPLPMYASILTGISVSNIVITGEGILDGGASFDNWWSYKREKPMPFRPRMLFLNHCSNVTVHGITVRNSPSWTLHPYFSTDLKFIDLKIQNPADSPNTDGMDPESCKNVDIIGIHFTVGDDCIAVKSGKIYMGSKHKTPCENIIIRNCLMESGHGAVTLGSEMAGGVKNLLVKDCVFLDTDRGLRIKTRRGRGQDAILDEIIFEDIEMDEVKTPFVINSFYFCDPDGHTEYVRTKNTLPVDERTPDIRTLAFRNIEAKNCHVAAFFLYGLPEKKIGRVELSNINVTYSPNAKAGYPAMMEELDPVSKMGLYANNITELQIQNVTITGSEYEPFIIKNIEHFIKE
ncbi:polygalacturonase [Anaerocolumna cellulosilytica]|uniref:Polygalacturonase n=1 Tax=Anaerocolumna cellulosilytica TaxID=433286 RepID=A0A6S6QX79_9FIRM|nr:glycoside hydrolase family 28 protein [Anaerocolumna cellulosilytica]MBB5196048.1 polygalacturonase [Anaerocolumna cellulosilytica]BCJ93649.1 polygalacturonase [Anaerocolumna cellulosilytica]